MTNNLPKFFKTLAIALMLSGASIIGQAQSITLLVPNGGEEWLVDSYEEISWTGQGLGNVMELDFSPDGGLSWWSFGVVPSTPTGGSVNIYVPAYLSTNAYLKITDAGNPALSDMSDAPFSVSFPPLSIFEPSSSSAVFANTLTIVYWTIYQQGITLLNAEISTDNGLTYTPLAQNINALMGSTYLILSQTPADSCILKLYNAADPSDFALSQVFQVIPAPVYTITSPVEGQISNTNSFLTISWNVQNLYAPENYIEFSADNGQNWDIIAYGITQGTSGTLEWYTPFVSSDSCLIRINDAYSLSSSAVSELFTIMPFPLTPVCMVTVDSLTNQNVIIWEKPDSDLIADFLIYKETDEFDVYEVIDTVSYADAPVSTDYDSNPAIRPYRYKIGFMDSENRVFPMSDFHQTIHLTINQGVNGNWNLIWTPYLGFGYTSYKIMRKSGNNPWEQIASISASFTSFTDFNAPSGNIAYMVKIVNPNGCNTGLRDAVYTDVYSNQAAANAVSVSATSKTSLSIYPVPANDRMNIQFGEEIKGSISVTITDFTGRIIHSSEYPGMLAGSSLPVDTSAFPDGVYLLNVEASGEKLTRKFVIRN
jgi:hypothetical protein